VSRSDASSFDFIQLQNNTPRRKEQPVKKCALIIMAFLLVLLCACQGEAAQPSAEATEPATTKAPRKIEPLPPLPEVIAEMAQGLETVRDFTEHMPAKWYWIHSVGSHVNISYYDVKPDGCMEPTPLLRISTTVPVSKFEVHFSKTTKRLPKALLDVPATITSFFFFYADMGLKAPGGIEVGDSAQALFDVFPDCCIAEQEAMVIYPKAEPEELRFAPLTNRDSHSSHWVLRYGIKDDVITWIELLPMYRSN